MNGTGKRGGAAARGGERGLTLIELAVALSIVGLALAIGVSFLQSWKDGIDLRNAAGRIAEVMLEARSRAIIERRTYTVTVDYDGDAYSVAPTAIAVRRWGSVDLYSDTADTSCPPLSNQTVAFRANGSADAAGYEAVYLRSRGSRVATRYRVKVLGATGKVGVEKTTGGSWVSAY